MNLLLDSAFKATLILLAAWGAALLLRRASADVRYTVWLVAILAVAMVPAALSIPQGAIPSAARFSVPAGIPAMTQGTEAAVRKLPWLFLIWGSGASLVFARLLLGIVAAARVTRSARLSENILYSDRAQTPMTWGFFRPVVILPAYASEWSIHERNLVIRHEQAHIVRRDWLWQILASLLTAVFWFHPLMWLADAQLRREAESAVDDFLLAKGANPSDYAGQLVAVARRISVSAPVAVIAMVRKPELETRVRSILDPARRRADAGIMVRCAVALAAAILIVPIAVTRQTVHAQGKVYKVGEGVSQPSIISKGEPVYDEDARAERIEGAVLVQGEVTPAGVIENVRVVKSLDRRLDEKAAEAVSKWRFKPGTKDGQPVSVFVRIEVNFHLR